MKEKIPTPNFKPSNLVAMVTFILGGGCLLVLLIYILLVWVK